MIGEPPPRSLNVNTAIVVSVASSRCQPDKYAHDKHLALVDAVTF